MSGYNPESLIADGFEYFGFAYLPQLITQNLANALARGDLKRAIDAKCGAAGASNAADLEKNLLASDPMSPNRFGFRTSDMGAYRLRIPFTQRRIPFFWGPRNPYLLTWAAAHSVGDRIEKVEQANEIKDPAERQKALDAIGNKDLYWAAFLTGSSMFLADYNRGWGVASRMPGISRWSALGSNSPYQVLLRDVTSNIQCNGSNGPSGGQPDAEGSPATEVAPVQEASPAAEAAPSPAVVEGANGVVDTVTRMSLDPDYTPQALEAQMCSMDFITESRMEHFSVSSTPVAPPKAFPIPLEHLVPVNAENVAEVSSRLYAQESNFGSISTPVPGMLIHSATGMPVIVAPMTAPLVAPKMPMITLPRPNFVLPMRTVIFRPVLVPQ